MPAAEALKVMYGESYLFSSEPPAEFGPDTFSERNDVRVMDFLRGLKPGLFVDYGCGRGRLLPVAAAIGWKVVGLEFNPESAKRVSAELSLPVHTLSEAERFNGQVDVVHLGDVIEHLCDPRAEILAHVLPLLKPGGYLLAQGPLREYNLFGAVLEASQILRRSPRSTNPPYHVLLPSPSGQRLFFRRLGLQEVSFELDETAWPAPAKFFRNGFSLREAALRAIRVGSQCVTWAARSRLGNRFFYAGQAPN
jgi:SAM-dependent methyltransferase